MRSLTTPLLVLVLALGVAACGGEEDGNSGPNPPNPSESASDNPTQPSPSTTTPTDDPSTASESPSEPVPGDEGEEGGAGGSADDAAVVSSMQTSLRALVDPKTTPQQKAARVVGGSDLAPLFEQFAQGGGGGDIAFTVTDPQVQGRTAVALVGATNGGQPLAAPERTPFVLADGEWRLERRTVCLFAQQIGLTCP